jgi:sugar phosphate isomerase/epimerase
MIFPGWCTNAEMILSDLSRSGLDFPVIHAEKGIGGDLGDPSPGARSRGLERLMANCRLGSALGAKLVVLHLWDLPQSDTSIDRNLGALGDCVAIAQEVGLELAVETIPCRRYDPLSNVRKALALDSRCLVALDTEFLAQHNQLELANASPWLWQGNRVRHVHIKDYASPLQSRTSSRLYLHPGEGDINFDHFFTSLRKQDFNGAISLEASVIDHKGTVDLGKLCQSLAHLRKVIASLR